MPDVAADASPHAGMAVVTSTGRGQLHHQRCWRHERQCTLMGGLVALADQYAGRHLGFVNSAIYRIGRGPLYHKAFHDVTSGDNSVSFPPETVTGYQASPRLGPGHGLGQPGREAS